MDIFVVDKVNLCFTCLNNIESLANGIDIDNCQAVLENPQRRSLLSSIFRAIDISIFSDASVKLSICKTCDDQILSLVKFFETCIESQIFFKHQVKAEVDSEEVLELLSSVQKFDEHDDSNISDDVPLSSLPLSPKNLSGGFHCQVCGRNFTSGILLANHTFKKHTGDLPHACDFCSEKFPTLSKLKRHSRDAHKRKSTLNSVCLKESDISYQCLECHVKFEDSSDLLRHQKEHEKQQYECWSCDETFDSSLLLLKHSQRHLKPGHRFTCYCGKSFNRSSRLTEHKALVHEKRDISQFECSECGKRFLRKQVFLNHRNSHLGLKPYLCSMCPQAYHGPSGLLQHVRRIHTHTIDKRPKSFLCDNCGKAFTRKTHLQRHYFRLHTPYKPRNYRCETCEKAFADAEGLRIHTQLHTKERNVKCPHCGKMFYKRYAMQSHINRVHLGLRPFPCTSCDMRFKVKAHLEKHMRTHTGEKPFPCPHCSYRCAEKSNLQKHIKTHLRVR